MPEEELKRKQQIMNTADVKMLFHAHYPGQKLLLARYANGWVLVDCFLFHHIKPKKKAKNKTKAGKSETQNKKRRGVRIMELGIMVCIVLLLSLAAVWISNKAVGLLEIHYFQANR
ncbi:hypothetical protein [Enterobacter cloacae complex sp. 288G10]|uniref:hypothetical protein n=1 Tax=Enterobacter cloacae complex sp. 288G10 TaxID=3395859 RepID=UPI003CF88DC4